MEQLLKDKICIVTGASRGIGQITAIRFAQEGAVVFATSRREGVHDIWAHQTNNFPQNRIHPLYFDISDTTSIRNNILEIKREVGRIDVLVNNAAVEYNEAIGMISEKNMEEMFRTNVYGTIQMLQYTARVMMRQGSGSIVNISSVVGSKGNPGQLVYSATKGAVIAATKSAAKELAPKGIRVNAVAPGLTRTSMLDDTSTDILEKRIRNISMQRLAEPEEIANACLFLASDLSSYVTGQIIGVDGCSIM